LIKTAIIRLNQPHSYYKTKEGKNESGNDRSYLDIICSEADLLA
jgi:hypothetical protein